MDETTGHLEYEVVLHSNDLYSDAFRTAITADVKQLMWYLHKMGLSDYIETRIIFVPHTD